MTSTKEKKVANQVQEINVYMSCVDAAQLYRHDSLNTLCLKSNYLHTFADMTNFLMKHVSFSFSFKDKCIFNQVQVNGIMTLLMQWVTPSVKQWDFIKRYELRGVWTQNLENKGYTSVNKKYPHFRPLCTRTRSAPTIMILT